MAFIEVIHEDSAEGELKEIYDNLIETRGKIAEVHKIQSLNPESIVNHMDLYMTIMFGRSPLKRVQREIIAVVVSKANNCEYCQKHHAEAVNHYWKDENKTNQLKKDYTGLNLKSLDMLLCDYAWELTKNPGNETEKTFIEPLKNEGLDDRAILDATLVIAYFNFVNRIVLSLGVHLEESVGGFKY
ncbi:MAG: peroxidase-related enzyme [Flavobacteriales bacterium]|nr:peroxidase-related enzyme [Flavobacteriales bacterium]